MFGYAVQSQDNMEEEVTRSPETLKRDLFGSKRKSDRWNLEDNNESPSKFLKIDESFSEDEEHGYLEEDAKRIPTKVTAPAIVEYSDSDDEFHISDGSRSESQTPVKVGPDVEITEYNTPTRKLTREESESPEKTPVLRAFRENNDAEIHEYFSPTKNDELVEITAQNNHESDYQVARDDSSAEDSSDDTTEHIEDPWSANPLYTIDDTVTLSLIVLRSVVMDDAEGRLEGNLVWSLCYDTTYDCVRYVAFVEKPNRKVKRGICLRLFPPWLASTLPRLEKEVIHSADLYQIIAPTLLNVSIEKIQNIMNGHGSYTYTKFLDTIPGQTGSQILEYIPQLQFQMKTVRKQTSVFRMSVNIDVMIWLIFTSPDAVQVLVRDCELIFAVIEIPRQFYTEEILPNKFCQFTNLSSGIHITDQTYTPLFSVLRSLGSFQETFVKFTWKPETTIAYLPIFPVPLPEIRHHKMTITELQYSRMEDARVATEGRILSCSKSELLLGEHSGCQIRILLLSSFNRMKLVNPGDVGKQLDIKFLRVSNETIYTLDQYSLVYFLESE